MSALAVREDVPPIQPAQPEAGQPFGETLEAVRDRASLELPDQTVPVAALEATHDGLMDVPGLGRLAFTTWSRRQLANLLGIRWDTWFSEEVIVPADRALEINRRLRASSGTLKVRARHYAQGEAANADAVLRAFVTPTYEPISDLEVFLALGQALAGRLDGFRFVRSQVTAESSQYAAASLEALDFGIRTADLHRPGFVIANSDVGSRSLLVWAWTYRLRCSNGLVVPDSAACRMVHRRRRDGLLAERLSRAVRLIPEHWSRSAALIRAARREPIADIQAAFEIAIRAERELRPISKAVLAAYEAEPEPTRFGLIQAITRAAQELGPERRLAVEEYAGRLLASLPGTESSHD